MTPNPSSLGLSSPSPPSRDRSSPTPQPARGPAVARVVKVLGSVVAAGLLASAAPVIALRDVAPATTAFMLRYTLTGDGPPLRYQWVDSDQIAPALALAAVASEDQKFPVHRGFDRAAMTKALASNRAGGQLRGASTISQQVAKNLFLWPARSWLRKGVEAYFTVLIETLWSKQRILEVYLNVAEFGPGIYGAEAAARHYFDRAAANLTAEQSALLAATLPSPSHSRPDRPSDYLRSRATWIRTQMRQLGPDYLVTPRPLAGDGR